MTDRRRAALYSRVSTIDQATEESISLKAQTENMEHYCEAQGLTIVDQYQDIESGTKATRRDFQRMLADAKRGRFDTIVCWKIDRLSRGLYPAARLMEVVEAHGITLQAVKDTIDLKTFGLMAAVGKIEIDNFKERSRMGKQGRAKQGRVPCGVLPYGYRTGSNGKPEIDEEQAKVIRQLFAMYISPARYNRSLHPRNLAHGVRFSAKPRPSLQSPRLAGIHWHVDIRGYRSTCTVHHRRRDLCEGSTDEEGQTYPRTGGQHQARLPARRTSPVRELREKSSCPYKT